MTTLPRSLFGYIWRFSKTQQIALTLLTLASFPFLYLSLELPKMIINDAIGGAGGPDYQLFGFPLDQISYLFVLSGFFLGLVFINGGFKYAINVFRGMMAERMLRRLRYMLFERVLRFPMPHFRKVSQGEVVSMVTSEAEPLGGFFGEAYSLPLYQGGILVTILTFIFIQNPYMGLAAIALYPMQGWLIPKLQKKVNQLNKERVKNIRKLSEHIGETVNGAPEIRTHETAGWELTKLTGRLGVIFDIRVQIYKRKFLIKFLNNFIAQITPFFFYSIGGYLAITGELSFGALVAALAAYKDLQAPWKELLGYYQRLADALIKYEQLSIQFEPDGMAPTHEINAATLKPIKGPLTLQGATWADEDGLKAVDGVSVVMEQPFHAAVTGGSESGRSELAQLITRLLTPTNGSIKVGMEDLSEIPASLLGRQWAYAGPTPYLFRGTIAENLFYGLKHRPVPGQTREKDAEEKRLENEALRSGNAPFDPKADWVDMEGPGYEDKDGMERELEHILSTLGLDEDIYRIGLQRRVDPASNGDFAERALAARATIRHRLEERSLNDLVEFFDITAYNDNATVLENLIFGKRQSEEVSYEALASHWYIKNVLEKAGLLDRMIEMGLQANQAMVDLFSDLPPGHEFFDRYSFVSAEDMPARRNLLRRLENKNVHEAATEDDKVLLLSVAMQLTPARHRLRLIDDGFRQNLLLGRARFREKIPDDLAPLIDLFDESRYNGAATVQDNLLFGRFAYGRAQSEERVGEVMAETARETGLFIDLMRFGLEADVGIGGSKLSLAMRQKVILARSMLKRPRLFVVDGATSALDEESRNRIAADLTREDRETSVIWVDGTEPAGGRFDNHYVMRNGKLSSTDVAPDAHAEEEATGGLQEEYRLLRAIPLLSGLDASSLKLLAFTSPRLTFRAGENLVRQGDSGDSAFIVIDGTAEILIEDGETVTKIRDVSAKDVIGEIALLADVPRSATIRATSDVTALQLAKEQFLGLIAQDQQIALQLLRVLADRLDNTTKQLMSARG